MGEITQYIEIQDSDGERLVDDNSSIVVCRRSLLVGALKEKYHIHYDRNQYYGGYLHGMGYESDDDYVEDIFCYELPLYDGEFFVAFLPMQDNMLSMTAQFVSENLVYIYIIKSFGDTLVDFKNKTRLFVYGDKIDASGGSGIQIFDGSGKIIFNSKYPPLDILHSGVYGVSEETNFRIDPTEHVETYQTFDIYTLGGWNFVYRITNDKIGFGIDNAFIIPVQQTRRVGGKDRPSFVVLGLAIQVIKKAMFKGTLSVVQRVIHVPKITYVGNGRYVYTPNQNIDVPISRCISSGYVVNTPNI